jgi:hypothetical protein
MRGAIACIINTKTLLCGKTEVSNGCACVVEVIRETREVGDGFTCANHHIVKQTSIEGL